jgi:hypothetical protein
MLTPKAGRPVVVGPAQVRVNMVIVPDGSWEAFTTQPVEGQTRLCRTRSTDGGKTWSTPEALRNMFLPREGFGDGSIALADRFFEPTDDVGNLLPATPLHVTGA